MREYCFVVVLLFVALSSVGTVYGANILVVVPTPSFSHHQFYRVFLLELHRRGHNLTVATPSPFNDSRMANYREIDLSYGYQIFRKAVSDASGLSTPAKMDPLTYILFYFKFAAKFIDDLCESYLSDPKLMGLYETNEKFDLVILEWGLNVCFNPFEKLSDGKVVGIASYEMGSIAHLFLGNPSNPSYLRDPCLDYKGQMSFWQRLETVLFYGLSTAVVGAIRWNEYRIAKKHFGADSTSVYDTVRKVALVFDNSHPAMTYPRPTAVNFVPLGGSAFHLRGRKAEDLPKDIQEFLDGAEHGVIYFSFGSNVKTVLGFEKEEKIFIESFGRVKEKILWKWENENVKVDASKVKISKWFPQVEILAHPKVKAFVTQGGLQSVGEAIEFKVPMIVVPFFADQGHNAAKLKSVGAAITLELKNLNVEDFTGALVNITSDQTYKNNMVRFSNLVKDQPMEPLKKAVWWIEYVIRHNGAPHLRSIAATMPWYQYYMVDVFCVFLLIVLTFIYVVRLIFKTLSSIVFKRNKLKKN